MYLMNKKLKASINILLIMSLSLFVACGGKSGNEQTFSTKLVVGSIAALANSEGGVVLIGQGAEGRFVKPLTSESITMDLKKGAWSFQALAWQGPGTFEGKLRCAHLAYTLDKDDEVLALSLSESNCSDALFGDGRVRSDDGIGFLPLEIQTCGFLARDYVEYGVLDFTMFNPECDSTPGKDQSYKIILNNVNLATDTSATSTPLESACLMRSSEASTMPLSLQFPALNIPFTVISYTDENCGATFDPPRTFTFDQGLHQKTALNDGFFSYYNNTHALLLDSVLCTGSWLTNLPFAQGDFDMNEDNYICSVEQLKSLDSTYTQYHSDHVFSSRITLLSNLDLSGHDVQVENTALEMEFNGENNTISGGDKALFSTLTKGKIERLRLDSFTVAATNSSNIGILANILNGDNKSIDIREVRISNSTISYTGTPNSGVGVIGQVLENIFMERVDIQNVDVIAPQNLDHDKIGILVGNFTSSNQPIAARFSNITVEDSSVVGGEEVGGLIGGIYVSNNGGSVSVRNVTIEDTVVAGVNNVGGIIGNFTSSNALNAELQISQASFIYDLFDVGLGDGEDITGALDVGGILGSSDRKVNIGTSQVFAALYHDSLAAGANFGGIVGRLEKGIVSDSNAYVDLTQVPGAFNLTAVGGIVGSLGVSGISSGVIHNCLSIVDFLIDGANIGGIAGTMEGLAAANERSDVRLSMALGQITDGPDAILTSFVGGIAGIVDNADITTSISHVTLDADQYVGGLAGQLENNSSILEGYSTSIITASAFTGGLVGFLNTSYLEQAIYDGHFSPINEFCTSCASLVGSVAGSTCTNISTGSEYFIADPGPPYTEAAVSNYLASCDDDAAHIGLNKVTGFFESPDFFDGVDGTLKFLFNWQLADPNLLSVGNALDPFPITFPEDWNAIADNSLLMAKAHILTNDIDFSSVLMIPLGTATDSPRAFTGTILGNGYALQNIFLDNSDCGGNLNCGVVRILGQAIVGEKLLRGRLGTEDSPLYIENIILDLDANPVNNAGIVGSLEAGTMVVRVSQADYQLSTGTSVGGLIGLKGPTGFSEIFNSSFAGTISTASGFQNIGGLAGRFAAAMGSSRLTSSFAEVEFAGTGGAVAGGLIGYADLISASGTMPLELRDNYAIISGLNSHVSSGGLIGTIDGNLGNMHMAKLLVQINTTASLADALVGALTNGAAIGGGNNVNSSAQGSGVSVAILSGGAQSTSIVLPDGDVASDWSEFLLNHDSLTYQSNFLFFGSEQRPYLRWEFPYDY